MQKKVLRNVVSAISPCHYVAMVVREMEFRVQLFIQSTASIEFILKWVHHNTFFVHYISIKSAVFIGAFFICTTAR